MKMLRGLTEAWECYLLLLGKRILRKDRFVKAAASFLLGHSSLFLSLSIVMLVCVQAQCCCSQNYFRGGSGAQEKSVARSIKQHDAVIYNRLSISSAA